MGGLYGHGARSSGEEITPLEDERARVSWTTASPQRGRWRKVHSHGSCGGAHHHHSLDDGSLLVYTVLYGDSFNKMPGRSQAVNNQLNIFGMKVFPCPNPRELPLS